MQVQNINQYNQQFTGIYKMPMTKGNVNALKKAVLPIADKQIRFQPGDYPASMTVAKEFRNIAKRSDMTLPIFRKVAHSFRINIPDMKLQSLFLFTGDDAAKYQKYLGKRIKDTSALKNIDKTNYRGRLRKINDENLLAARFLTNIHKNENSAFQKFLDGKVIEVKDTQELLSKLIIK